MIAGRSRCWAVAATQRLTGPWGHTTHLHCKRVYCISAHWSTVFLAALTFVFPQDWLSLWSCDCANAQRLFFLHFIKHSNVLFCKADYPPLPKYFLTKYGLDASDIRCTLYILHSVVGHSENLTFQSLESTLPELTKTACDKALFIHLILQNSDYERFRPLLEDSGSV